MNQRFLLFSIILFYSGLCWSQGATDLTGKWSLKKVKLNDSLFYPDNIMATFFSDNSFIIGEIKSHYPDSGRFELKDQNTLLLTSKEPWMNGSFEMVISGDKNFTLHQDSLTYFFSRFLTPADFTQDSKKSQDLEMKGWQSFKTEDFEATFPYFQQAYYYDSTNYDALVGLVYAKAAHNGDFDSYHMDIIIKNTEMTSWELGITAAAFLNEYSPKSEKEFSNEELSPEKIAAFYTGGSFVSKYQHGETQQKGHFEDKKRVGTWINYRRDGTIKKTSRYHENDSLITYTYHLPSGEAAKKSIVLDKGDREITLREYVYYQELPDSMGVYLFVSETGFCTYDRDKKITFDSTTPDNFIEEVHDFEKGRKWYIWKDGERQLYRDCELDGVEVWEYESEQPGKYRWENCEKKYIGPIDN